MSRTVRMSVRLATAALGLWLSAMDAAAAQDSIRNYRIAEQPLGEALREFALANNLDLLFSPDLVAGKKSASLEGEFSIDEGLRTLLRGSGLQFAVSGSRIVISEVEQGPAATSSQDASDERFKLEEIVVTATKKSQRLLDVPASITAETGAQLRQRGAIQLQDIVMTTPGLSNPGPGGGNRTNLVIRGVTTDLSANLKQTTVAVLFDDIPVDPATAGMLTTNLRIVDVERVEVLRGPQGTLFGSGSIGGAVRYITNKPDATDFSGSIEGSFAGTQSAENSQWGNVVLNLPLVADRVALRAVGYRFNDGGWIDNIRLNRQNVNRNETYGGRIALAAQATDQLSVTLTGAYQDSHDFASGESLYAQPMGYSNQITNDRAPNDSTVKSTLVNLGITYDFGSVSLFSSSTYIDREVEIVSSDASYIELVRLTQGLSLPDDGTPNRMYNFADIYTQELRLASNGGGPFRWTVGGFYLRSNTPEGGQRVTLAGLTPYVGTDDLINISSPGRQEEIAGFGEATYTIADKVDLTAGLRVARTTLDITSVSSGLLVTGGTDVLTFHLPERETAYNPRVSVLYRPTSQVSIYAQMARGYRIGGANLTAGIGGPGIPRTYDSDHLWNYEAGLKSSLLDGRLQINTDVYYIDWKDLQVSLLANNFNYTGNGGAARIYGFELEVAAKPASWLDLGGSLSLNDAALTEDAPTLVRTSGIVGAKDGDRLPASPQVQGSAYAQLNFSFKDDTAYIRASGQYVGSSYIDFDSQGVRFGDYETFDVRAGFVHNNIEVGIFGRNLLDSDGKQSAAAAYSIGAILVDDPYAYRIRPRTIGLSCRVGF